MLKKLLALFGIGKEEDDKPAANSYTQPKPTYPQADVDEDDEDEDEDEDNDDIDNDDSDDDDDNDPMYQDSDPSENTGATDLDPVTLHGKHYTIEEFDAEVERRVQKQVKEEIADGEEPDEHDIKDYKFEHRRAVYIQWNKASTQQMIDFEALHSFEQTGIHSFSNTPHDENNPLLQPIHGVTLQDYAAIMSKIGTGMDMDTMLKTLGVDKAAWEEASVLWTKRMQEDLTFAVVNLYGKYFKEADDHPKLGASLQPEISETGLTTLERMKADREFFTDVQAEMNAAYEYGIDGAQQAFEKYGVNIGDISKIALHYSEIDGNNMEQMDKWARLLDRKMKEYADKYAAEQGGNIADDIEF
ncbi:DUF6620 family protein [Prevotella sp. 10(H)]|uniref:DUF6620 family protein n=1 Tax=Prevotella sp. 10(H) TaxID=1158294 RepID=UPI0004A71587|nr:DUF6620 family protein [Prevotella sp. 10(H)]